MNTEERVKETIEMFRRAGQTREFYSYLKRLREEDPLAYRVAEVHILSLKNQFPLAVKKGSGLISKVGDRPWLAWRLFTSVGTAYRGMGEIKKGEAYLLKALEMAERIGDRESICRTKLQIYTTRVFGGEYDQAYRDFLDYRRDNEAWEPHVADYTLGTLEIIRGRPAEAVNNLNRFLRVNPKTLLYFAALEVKGLAFRMLRRVSDALETFLESAKGYAESGSSYLPFPVAKALEISRLAGLEPPPGKLIRKALALARKGGWGEQAAAEEIEALLREDDAEAAEGLYLAAKNYLRAYQNIEAFFSGLTAAYLGWKTDRPVFTKALKLIAPLVPLHPGFRKDPLLGGFLSNVMPLLNEVLRAAGQDHTGIRAYLIGELKVIVDGKEISLIGWRRDKAIKAFCYLLLSSQHRIPMDHLFYLLWPRRSYNKKSRFLLYTAIDTIRKHLGRRELLTKKRDFYQLEETWTDLGEIENLVRLADATTDPAQKEEYLARARELAKGELLPEFPYDKHIEEYREYYKTLRRRLFGLSEESLGVFGK